MSAAASIDAMAPRRPSVMRFLAVALAAPAVLLAASWWLGSEYAVAERMRVEAGAAYDRRAEAGTLIARIADAESSQRGFVITGNPAFLSGYAPARKDAAATFDTLAGELAGEPEQAALLAQLRDLAAQKFAEMDGVIADRRSGGLNPAIRRVASGRGQQLMERMREDSARMLKLAERDRDARILAYRARVEADRVGLWIGIAATALLLFAAAVLIWRQGKARYRARLAAYSIAERNRSILDSTIDAIAILNPSGTIETINAAAATMLGYRPDELERRDIGVLIRLLDRPITFHERIGLVDGRLAQPYLSDRKIVHRDGHEIPVDIALGVMSQPDGHHIVASVRDVSERKRIERVKEELISTVSHELRTPLTSVVGALGLLRAGSGGEVPAQAARLIEIAENNSRRLIRLINDMLDIDRIQSGRLQLDRVTIDLRDPVRRACEGSQGLANAAGVAIACEMLGDEVPVAGDADRLLQVITNLVSNAVRVSPPGGMVTIGLLHGLDSRARVTVDDDGPGVPAEFRDRIFGRFERAEGEQRSGTGLGLAISREIVARHDGRIWFEDRNGGGTRFAFTLDLVHDPQAGPAPLQGSWVLICGDDSDLVEHVRGQIVATGYRADAVATAAAAHAALASARYRAVLIDLDLAGESGLSVARSLRAAHDAATLPIVIVSARMPSGRSDYAALDVHDWIEKPVDPSRLALAIRQAVRGSGKKRPVVLHLDDDRDVLEVVASALGAEMTVVTATDLSAARAIVDARPLDAVILDLHLAEGSGLELLPFLSDERGLAVPTIIFSAHDVTDAAARQVDAVLVKSRGSLPDLTATVRQVLADRADRAA